MNTVSMKTNFGKILLFISASAILNNMTKLIASAGAACHSQLDSFSVTKPSRVLIDSGVPEHLALK